MRNTSNEYKIFRYIPSGNNCLGDDWDLSVTIGCIHIGSIPMPPGAKIECFKDAIESIEQLNGDRCLARRRDLFPQDGDTILYTRSYEQGLDETDIYERKKGKWMQL